MGLLESVSPECLSELGLEKAATMTAVADGSVQTNNACEDSANRTCVNSELSPHSAVDRRWAASDHHLSELHRLGQVFQFDAQTWQMLTQYVSFELLDCWADIPQPQPPE